MRRCRYCKRDITEKPGTALWIDAEGIWVCSGTGPDRIAHLPA